MSEIEQLRKENEEAIRKIEDLEYQKDEAEAEISELRESLEKAERIAARIEGLDLEDARRCERPTCNTLYDVTEHHDCPECYALP